MDRERQLRELGESIDHFKNLVGGLPEPLFLKPIHEWSPRDVVAHLIGWNRHTIEGCMQILQGEEPFYFGDAENDFSHVNAESIQRYSSASKNELIGQMTESCRELKAYLLSVDPMHWEMDHGVKYRNWVITISNTVDALRRDYDVHREQIEEWLSSSKSQR
ncbi:MAG TPA: ClbS/DfsB family four-helix bundle protein [Anaerolineae bacterium]|nr:ClbS/DfsB family four-helix bundle protein [Anaerolineae bacterium]